MSNTRLPALTAIASFSTALLAASGANAAFGPSWEGDLVEDAKDGANTAQLVATGSPITTINGSLGSFPFAGGEYDLVDMYLIRLDAPAMLKISTAGGGLGGSADFDSQLFLFRAEGAPGSFKALALLASNDSDADSDGAFIGPASNDGSGFVVTAPGAYFIAISAFGTSPFTNLGDPIWGPLVNPGEIAFGQNRELIGWSTPGQVQGGAYSIRIEGFSGVPSPGAVALLGLAGLIRRRQR